MRSRLRKIVEFALGFIIGLLAITLVFLRNLLDTGREKHEAAKLDADVKKDAVEAAKDAVQVAEDDAAQTHESVEQRLARLEEEAQRQRTRDSVEVANDIIKGT